MPSVTVVVPVYNVENYLEFCVSSLKKQTLQDIEIILVDDGSPDKSGEICDRLALEDDRISVIHKENGGLSSARNAGIAASHGDYIGFVDSDDWVEPDMFELLYKAAKENDADIADCDMIEISDREFIKLPDGCKTSLLNKNQALEIFFRITKSNINYCVCDKIFKREMFEKVLFTEGIIFEDIDFNYRALIAAEKMVILDAIKYYYYKNPLGISRNLLREKDLELLAVWDRIIDLSKIHTPEYTKWAIYNRQRADFGLLCKMLKYGCRESKERCREIRKMLLISIRKNYFSLMRGNMPKNRKILLSMLAVNYRLVSWPLLVRRRIVKK